MVSESQGDPEAGRVDDWVLSRTGLSGAVSELVSAVERTAGRPLRRGVEAQGEETFLDAECGWLRRAGAVLRRRGAEWLLAGGRPIRSELVRLAAVRQRWEADWQPTELPPGPVRDHLRRCGGPTAVHPVGRGFWTGTRLDVAAGPRLLVATHAPCDGGPVLCEVRGATAAGAEAEAEDHRLRTALTAELGFAEAEASLPARIVAHSYESFPVFGMIPQLVHPEDRLLDSARRIVGHLTEEIAANEPAVRAGLDAVGVHEMRVAARRARTALRIFGDVWPSALVGHLSTELRWLRDLLGDVRDPEVYIDHWPRYLGATPAGTGREALRLYEAELMSHRSEARLVLLAAIGSGRYRRLVERLRQLLALAADDGERAGMLTREAGRQLLLAVSDTVIRRGEKVVRAPSDEEFHRLRTACKNLRYTCEWLAPLYPGVGDFALEVKSLQGLLGRHQDAVVAAAHFQASAAIQRERLDDAGQQALGRLATGQRAILEQCRLTFPEQWVGFRYSHERVAAVLAP